MEGRGWFLGEYRYSSFDFQIPSPSTFELNKRERERERERLEVVYIILFSKYDFEKKKKKKNEEDFRKVPHLAGAERFVTLKKTTRSTTHRQKPFEGT